MGGNSSKKKDQAKEFVKNGYDCGCLGLPQGSSASNAEPVELPLRKIIYDIEIINGVAEVSFEQTYQNQGKTYLQLQYRFPINPNSCLHKFSATFSNMRMQGVVKEKQVAKLQYAEAVKMGKRAALGDVSDETKDIFTIQIGNLGPGQEVKIQLNYTEELTISMNTFYQFNFLTKLSPRYMNTIPKQDILSAFRKQANTKRGKFEWDFKLRLRASRKIIGMKSLCHPVVVQKKNDQNTELSLTLDKGQTLDKPFTFIYTTQNFELPSYLLGNSDTGSSVMVSFIPKFCQLNLKDAEIAALDSKVFETDMDSVRGEYIFLLDRSGSMDGQPIEKAKEALILFLKSLPIDTYFQVVSFGSGSQKIFDVSKKNSNQSISKAIQEIQSMGADLGGTQIYSPLSSILQSKVIEGYPKQVFLLTDGQISDTQQVIDLVRKNVKYSRVHTIGIGSSVSEALIIGCAEKGKGQHIFIREGEDPSNKIIQLLNDSLTPVISKVELSYDKDIVESIVPNPEKMPYILKGEVANFYVTFKSHLSKPTSISLSYIDSMNNLPFKSELQITPDNTNEYFVEKLSHFHKIRAIEESQASGGNIEDYLYYVKKVDKKKEIIDLSTKHQILSKHTAFICVEKHLKDGKYEEVKSKGQQKIEIVEINAPPPEREIQSYAMMKCCSAPPRASPVAYKKMAHFVPRGAPCSDEDEAQECEDIVQRDLCFVSKAVQEQAFDMMDICQAQKEQDCEYQNETAFATFQIPKDQNKKQINIVQQKSFQIKEIVKEQLFQGYWNREDIITYLYNSELLKQIQGLADKDAVITYLIVIWIEKHHPEKEYSLIVKKARNWLKKQARFAEFSKLYDLHLK